MLIRLIFLTFFPLLAIAASEIGKESGEEHFFLREIKPKTVKINYPSDTLPEEIKWNTAPSVGFVFEINNQEAERLLTKSSSDELFKELLHTLIDTFDVEKGWTNRPGKGHFILARIVENKLHCEYIGIFPYQVFLLKEYDALALQVLDLDGNVREDARVKFRWKRMRIDPESKTYRLENKWVTGENEIVTVELDGFRSVFNIEKHKVPTWNNWYDTDDDDGPTFYSYMITDKNRYKPDEKVRFKSYALSQSRTPLRKDLEIWLINGGKSTKVGQVTPHRPGSYADEFHLHDSLKLVLDRSYLIQLREKRGRIVASCHFKYEDYELHGNKLEVKLNTYTHFHPAKNQVSITATDINGLILKDARASIVVRTQAIRETFQPLVILPDTLQLSEINLNQDKATVIDIPSHLFQKTNTAYEVHVVVLNSQNQRIEQTVAGLHYYSQYEITTRFSNDSIIYELLNNGQPMENVPIKMQRAGEVESKEILLPYKEKINPAVSRVYLQGDLLSREINMNELIPKLDLAGGIQKDSFNILLNNPQKVDVSWFVYQGGLLLQKGFGKEFEYKTIINDREQTFYVELLYSFGGQENIKTNQYEFKEDYLDVALNIPDRVYPGQKVDATIQVNDQLGRPVSNVDLTALAVTAKLGYYLPQLPYYGSSSEPRSKRAHYSKRDINKRSAVLNLDYKKWVKLARLDTMKYYQLIYPGSQPFKYSFDISDSTQFAPYVVQEGNAKQVYVIEVNRSPIYFSWVDQPKSYSFYVKPSVPNQISLRLHDRVLVLDSIPFEAGKKTIFSIDLDHLPKGVKIFKLFPPTIKKDRKKRKYPAFTQTEINRYLPYIAAFGYNYGNTYLESGKQFTPLFNVDSRNKTIIVGPITPGKLTYVGLGSSDLIITYQHTGGFKYAFEDNIVYKLNTDNLIPERLFESSFSPGLTINDRVMTKKIFLENQKYAPSKWQTQIIDLVGYGSRVQVLLPDEKDASGIGAFLFENYKTKQIISPCPDQSLSKLEYYTFPQGLQNVIVVYNNGKYLKMDSIDLQSYSNIVIDLKYAELRPRDTFSETLLTTNVTDCYTDVPTPVKRTSYTYSYTGIGNVRGTVYDDDSNESLTGVSVIVVGTTIGTITDMDGNFTLNIPEHISTLQFSFIGYVPQEIEVQVGTEMSVYLEMDVQRLQEVIVVGYGSKSKRNITGALLSGRVAGINISLPEEKSKEEEGDQVEETQKEAEQQLCQELLTLNSIRSNFSDVGFWEPKLYTDNHGQSKFTVTFPDDITRWDAAVYAMNRQLKTGITRKSIKSYKPIMAELHVPQFLTQGDSAFFLGKVLNYSNDKKITGKVNWSGANIDFEKNIEFSEFQTDKLAVNAVSTDSITTRYLFTRDDGYRDGEERTVPVVEQGIIRAEGTLSILKNNDELQVKASNKANLTVEILSNQLDIYSGEVKYLLNYKYACNEQLASKLIGILNHKLLMQYKGKPFKYDRDINKIIERLLKNQNEEFLWSWWNVSPNTSYWMSAHILRALKVAKDAGYTVNLDIDNIASKASYRYDFLGQYHSLDTDILNALASWGANLNYGKHIRKLDSIINIEENSQNKSNKRYNHPYSFLKEKLLLLEVRQMMKLPYQRDSLLRYKKEGIMGEIFFSDNKPAMYWYEDGLAANAIAYRIVKKDSLLKGLLIPMQLYFLSQRKSTEWNTYESSNVLTSILPDIIAQGSTKESPASIKLSGTVNETINEFPYRLELKPEEVLHIQKVSGLPMYFMQYSKERVTKAKTGVEGFEIKTQLGSDNTAILEAGKPIPLIVDVNVKKEAKYENIMIEVPIPGACSYADKRQTNQGVETHREYFKDRTVIFCENMRSGKYTFVIQLLPRFTGKYLINPSQVSLMYVPVVNANTDLKVVSVE